jgi:nucleoside-diphosphate-sugar epimerase
MSKSGRETVLVTGANGFVGSRLCGHLRDAGYNPIAGIRRGCDMSLIDELNLDCRYGDVTRPETLPDMVKDIDYIVHNAGLVKTKRIEQFMEVNQQGTKNLLEASLGNPKLKKLVYVSSMAAVGPSERDIPMTEDAPPHPPTAYGRSKAAGEQEVLAMKDRINAVIVRPSGVYGPGDTEMFSFFQVLDNRIRPYLGSWKRKISLVHVDDLCYAVSLALKAETKSGAAYFIAESRSYTYAELVKYLQKAVGRAAFPLYLPGWLVKLVAKITEKSMRSIGKTPMFTVEKACEILADWYISVEKAERELGFKSRIPFPQGAKETFCWYRDEGWL